jgi:hypothetical protein
VDIIYAFTEKICALVNPQNAAADKKYAPADIFYVKQKWRTFAADIFETTKDYNYQTEDICNKAI